MFVVDGSAAVVLGAVFDVYGMRDFRAPGNEFFPFQFG